MKKYILFWQTVDHAIGQAPIYFNGHADDFFIGKVNRQWQYYAIEISICYVNIIFVIL